MDTVKPQTGVWFVAAWFGATLTTLILALTLTFYLSITQVVTPKLQNFKLYAALPQIESEVSQNIQHSDARAKIIKDFFTGYISPLADLGQQFVDVADKYQLDYRLLPSIAMQESLGGKKVIKDSHNPFGYGIYEDLVIRFNSWEEAIERVGRALREDYLNQGLKNPAQIMAKYTPPALSKGGNWAKGVSSFMEELR